MESEDSSESGANLQRLAPRLRVNPQVIPEFCERWHIVNMALSGSVLREDFSEQSDIDVLVEFEQDKTPGFDFLTIADELTELFERKLDLLTRPSVERSENYLRREAILQSAEEIYVAR